MSVKILPAEVLDTMTYREKAAYDDYLTICSEEVLNQIYDYYMFHYKLYNEAFKENRLDSQHTIQTLLELINVNLEKLCEMERVNPRMIYEHRTLPGGLYILFFGQHHNYSSFAEDIQPFFVSHKVNSHIDEMLSKYEDGYDLHYSTFYDINKLLEDTIEYWLLRESFPSED